MALLTVAHEDQTAGIVRSAFRGSERQAAQPIVATSRSRSSIGQVLLFCWKLASHEHVQHLRDIDP